MNEQADCLQYTGRTLQASRAITAFLKAFGQLSEFPCIFTSICPQSFVCLGICIPRKVSCRRAKVPLEPSSATRTNSCTTRRYLACSVRSSSRARFGTNVPPRSARLEHRGLTSCMHDANLRSCSIWYHAPADEMRAAHMSSGMSWTKSTPEATLMATY